MSFPIIFAAGCVFVAVLVAGVVWLYGRTRRPVSLARHGVPSSFPAVQVVSVRVIPASPEEAQS